MEEKIDINVGYMDAQLQKAVNAGNEDRKNKWNSTIQAFLQSTVKIGDRVPTTAPAWVTLEVLKGGFAVPGDQGRPAGGDLKPNEKELYMIAKGIQLDESFKSPNGYRKDLNLWSFDPATGGQFWLDRLSKGLLRVPTAEEGCALVIQLLIRDGHIDEAKEIINTISPWIPKLRFFPQLATTQFPMDAETFIEDVQSLLTNLQDWGEMRPAIAEMISHITIGVPLYDELVSLVNQTVVNSWPYQKPVTPEFKQAYESWTNLFKQLPQEISTSQRFGRRSGYTFRMTMDHYIKGTLEAIEVGRCRVVLQGVNQKCDQRPADFREKLMTSIAHHGRGVHYRKVVLHRLELANLIPDQGIPESILNDHLLIPVTQAEIDLLAVDIPPELPDRLKSRLRRATKATAAQLIAQEIIKSPEMLANSLEHIIAQLKSSGLTDAPLVREVNFLLLKAFWNRRSLLLLDLQSQIKADEIHWIKMMKSVYQKPTGTEDLLVSEMKSIIQTYIETWPSREIPNELIHIMRELGVRPMVDGLAADIFMGTFGIQFYNQARSSAKILQGTIYSRYYGLYDIFGKLLGCSATSKKQRYGKEVVPDFFMQFCESVPNAGNSVVRNGAIIERCAVLTTHNTLTLLQKADLLKAEPQCFLTLAKSCFDTGVQKPLSTVNPEKLCYRGKLLLQKDIAIAVRQMIIFLALAERQGSTQSVIELINSLINEMEEKSSMKTQNAILSNLKGVKAAAESHNQKAWWKAIFGWVTGSEGRIL